MYTYDTEKKMDDRSAGPIRKASMRSARTDFFTGAAPEDMLQCKSKDHGKFPDRIMSGTECPPGFGLSDVKFHYKPAKPVQFQACESQNETNDNTAKVVQFRGRNVLRRQAAVADRHAIPVPDEAYLAVWAKTLMQERIATLFLTQDGLAGHAQQVNQEIARLKNILEVFSCEANEQNKLEYIQLATGFLKDIKSGLIKFAAEAAHKKHYTFNIRFDFPFNEVLTLSTNSKGSLLVNGRKYGA